MMMAPEVSVRLVYTTADYIAGFGISSEEVTSRRQYSEIQQAPMANQGAAFNQAVAQAGPIGMQAFYPAQAMPSEPAATVQQPQQGEQTSAYKSSLRFYQAGEVVSKPGFMASPLMAYFVYFICYNTLLEKLVQSEWKKVERLKRISSQNNMQVNLAPFLELCKGKNATQLNGILEIFYEVFFDQAKNLLSDKQSVESKFQYIPTLLGQINKNLDVSLFNYVVIALLGACPVAIGCCTAYSMKYTDSYTVLLLFCLMYVPGISHRSVFVYICKSQKYCLEELGRKSDGISVQQYARQIIEFIIGVLNFVQHFDGDKEKLKECFNYSPFGDNLKLIDYYTQIQNMLEDKAEYSYLLEDIKQKM